MAVGKSGYIDVTVKPSSVGLVRLYWREDYDVLGNYSTITVTDIQGYIWHRSGWATLSLQVLADEAMFVSSAREWRFSANTDTTLRSVVSTSSSSVGFTPITSGRIYHNEDGTKTTNITFNLVECFISSAGFQGSSSTVSQTVVLTSIPRASVLSADNGTLGVAQTLTVDRKASGYTHSIGWVCGTASGTICTKSSALSFNWTPSIELANQNTTGASVSAVFTITTYSGDTAIGSKTLNVIYAIPDSVKPSVTMTITDANGYADKYGGYVQKRSKLKVVLGVVTAYGSEISVNAVSVEGVTYYGESIETAIINGSGAVEVTATVTDKRGRVGTATVNVDVLEYASPAILGVTYNRANADGTDNPVGEHAEVTMNASVTALGGNNSATYRLQYKKLSDSTYTDFDMSGYQNVYSLENVAAVFSAAADYSYNIVFTVSDDFSEKFGVAKTEFVLQTGKVLMHRRAKGVGMGLGRICEEDDLLDVDWNIRGRKNLDIDGDANIDGALAVGDAETTRKNLNITAENVGAVPLTRTVNGKALSDDVADADFVVAEGVSGGWRYRKWNNGNAELWRRYRYSNVTLQSSGNGAYQDVNVNLPFPFGFTNIDNVHIGVDSLENHQQWVSNAIINEYNLFTIGLNGWYTGTVGGCFDIYVFGQWK